MRVNIFFLCLLVSILIVSICVWAINYYGLPARLNEIGDALSGFASALAFVWLVGGTFIQQRELSETNKENREIRRASEAQAEEMRLESCARDIRYFFDSMDLILDELSKKVVLICDDLDDKYKAMIRPYTVVGFLGRNVVQQEAKNKSAKNILKFSAEINEEIVRFYSRYSELMLYLEERAVKERFYLPLIKDGPYSLICEEIERMRAVDSEQINKIFGA